LDLLLPWIAWAQSTPPYQPIRYEEDWSAWRDRARHRDGLDRLKYLGLGREGWYVTIAGEARERYDRIDYPGFGSGPSDLNGFFLQRYLFSGDFHLGKRFRFFAEMQSGLAHGRIGGPRPTDSDQLEAHQGLVNIDLGRVPRGALVLRAGRQEIWRGSLLRIARPVTFALDIRSS
jgi:hypothetical protein